MHTWIHPVQCVLSLTPYSRTDGRQHCRDRGPVLPRLELHFHRQRAMAMRRHLNRFYHFRFQHPPHPVTP
ncbi:hypothetical protein JG688_00013792 [Phytophthora aleatoria]|uniref:Uncharacterized protein n=1 Tax=Phytophthora aleatoria TaxID=2496075 RepID=A0A8J5M0W9_9STRA|nr:hypothetical protein JG688_00013792 [Phytophthora aleatoria]